MRTIRTILFVSSWAILIGFTLAAVDDIVEKGITAGNVIFLVIVFALWWVLFRLQKKYGQNNKNS